MSYKPNANDAPRDRHGVPGTYTKAGVLLTSSGGRRLKQVIKLSLITPRDHQLFEIGLGEITIAIADSPFILNVDNPADSHGMTITGSLHISVLCDRFYITNQSSAGNLELWIWE